MIRVALVDDEPLARRGLRLHLAGEADVTVVGEAGDGPAAVRLLGALEPDLVFLDVQMPGMNGLEVLAEVAAVHLPVVIFVTAWDRYAIRAFEVRAIDYLLKPFTRERFAESLRRARRELATRGKDGPDPGVVDLLAPGGAPLERLTVRSGDRYLLVPTDQIDWLQAAANYVEIHRGERRYLLRSTLAALERQLDPRRFVRIHRSRLVALDRVTEIRPDAHGDYDVTLRTGAVIRMSRTYRDRLLSPFPGSS